MSASFQGMSAYTDNTDVRQHTISQTLHPATTSLSSLPTHLVSKSPGISSHSVLSSSIVSPASGHYSPIASPVRNGDTTTEIVDVEHEPSEGYHSMDITEKEREKERERRQEGEGQRRREGRQNALLQVSEAHLAILPDEDGDT